MKSPAPIVIIGSQGFAKEVKWLIDEINATPQRERTYTFLGYIDQPKKPTAEKVLGDDHWAIQNLSKETQFIIAIGDPGVRKKVADIYLNAGFSPATLIHPSALLSPSVSVGLGTIICAGATLTVDISVGNFCILNLHTTLGHGSTLAHYVTLSPGVHISGEVSIGSYCEVGTGAVVLPGKKIADHIYLGAGALATTDLPEAGTYVGIPAKLI